MCTVCVMSKCVLLGGDDTCAQHLFLLEHSKDERPLALTYFSLHPCSSQVETSSGNCGKSPFFTNWGLVAILSSFFNTKLFP